MIRPLPRLPPATLLLAAPARADFASCVASLKSEAASQGISAATLKAAFDGLQPDTKVLEFETSQPEFKTPIWDYMAALVDDERVADGKAAMAANAGRARQGREALRRQSPCHRGDLGRRIQFRPATWASARWCNR